MADGYTQIINPATGEVIGRSLLTDESEIKKIIDSARNAQAEWFKLGIKKRVKLAARIRDAVAVRADEIADIIARDNGKTKVDALATEVLPAAMAVTYYCKHAKCFLKDKKLRAGNIFLINKRSRIVNVPYGVVGIISPWNYPFAIPFSEVIMALLAGNSVILKTASETQLVGQILKEVIESAGLPENVFNYINLPGKKAGDLLLENGVDKLFFTGSVPVGKYLMEKAAKTLTPVVLELGGNDPMIVCEDADPYRAAMGALWAGFQNAGQSCGGVERIYVHEKVYEPFMKVLCEQVNNLKVGPAANPENQMGCVATSKQAETIKTHVDEAVKKGAVISASSKIPDEKNLRNFVPAMVITNVNHSMTLMKDETFGPVVGVMKFTDIEDAVRLANDSNLGLTASVWTKSSSKGSAIARRLLAGAVTINDHLMSHGLAETPWGGFKESGVGRTHGEIGFDEMTRKQVIVTDLLSFASRNLWWHPHNKEVYDGIKGILEFAYSSGIGSKLKGLKNLIKIAPRMFSKKG